jgi:hypothetical protein
MISACHIANTGMPTEAGKDGEMRILLTVVFGGAAYCAAVASEPIDIGSRLELVIDDYLIRQITGGAELRLHWPVERERVLAHDTRWKGNRAMYYTVFQDGGIYGMYYRGSQVVLDEGLPVVSETRAV